MRVQRTRSSPSAPHSPLTRRPLGRHISCVALTAIVALSVFVVSPVLLGGEKKAESSTLQISAVGNEPFRQGEPMPVRCVFANPGAQPVTILLRDHDAYLGTLEYPGEMQIHVVDAAGRLVTKNEIDGDGWWNWFYLSSQFSVEEPGDRITIPPGDHVTRVVHLEDILRGCPGISAGLARGRFTVQLRLGNIVSNSLVIDVTSKVAA
jgi:hypothetical protein